ncbi:MAG TPA: DUF2505 family protein [Acidimicrobiales bacterium]|nr:DUF2505 family protein [Acidimicrobiales bacterium]
MRFEVDQAIAAPVDRVLAELVDPTFYEALAGVPGVDAPRLMDRTVEGEAVRLVLAFAFAGSVSGAIRTVVDPSKLTWAVHLTVRPSDRTAEFVVVPDHYPDLLQGSGSHRFTDRGAGGTVRTTGGDLLVRVPLLGRKAEKAIVDGFRRHLLAEGELLAERA